MPEEPRSILIVTLPLDADIQATKKLVSEIRGVSEVDFNYITHKLRVRYDGDGKEGPEIQDAIKKIIARHSR